MPQRGGVDINPAGRVRQRADPDEIRRDLRRNHVQHLELASHLVGAAIRVHSAEGGGARRAIDAGEGVAEIQVDPVGVDVFHQRRHIVGTPNSTAPAL